MTAISLTLRYCNPQRATFVPDLITCLVSMEPRGIVEIIESWADRFFGLDELQEQLVRGSADAVIYAAELLAFGIGAATRIEIDTLDGQKLIGTRDDKSFGHGSTVSWEGSAVGSGTHALYDTIFAQYHFPRMLALFEDGIDEFPSMQETEPARDSFGRFIDFEAAR